MIFLDFLDFPMFCPTFPHGFPPMFDASPPMVLLVFSEVPWPSRPGKCPAGTSPPPRWRPDALEIHGILMGYGWENHGKTIEKTGKWDMDVGYGWGN